MKLSIRMKIFLPFLIFLIAFPAAVWFAFSYALDGHMNYNARRDLGQMIQSVGELAARREEEASSGNGEESGIVENDGETSVVGNSGETSIVGNSEETSGGENSGETSVVGNSGEISVVGNDGEISVVGNDGETSGGGATGAGGDTAEGNGSLLSDLRGVIQTEPGETKMLVMNDRFRVLYPRNYDDQPEMTKVYALAVSTLTQPDSPWPEGEITKQAIDDGDYLLYYRPVNAGADEQVKHIILYCPVHDTAVILQQVSRLVLMIMGAMAAVSIVVFWFVAGSISGPVRRLCRAARGIGEKKFQKVETGATVRELCELEDEINQMQEKLLQADQAERTFFQNASHELRTPLMSISGYAQGIQRGVFTDTSQAAGVILDESSRLTEVVDGILTLTRMDQLRYQVIPVEVNLQDFIEEQFERLEGLAYSKKINLVLNPGKEHILITDVQLLERAFSNIVSNCIRYAAREVRVTAREEGTWLDLVVTDDGPGLREEELEHLFDRFYKGKDGNHGLGLAIARASLEYMGAFVRAVSSENGAVFIMRLPQDCRSFTLEEKPGI